MPTNRPCKGVCSRWSTVSKKKKINKEMWPREWSWWSKTTPCREMSLISGTAKWPIWREIWTSSKTLMSSLQMRIRRCAQMLSVSRSTLRCETKNTISSSVKSVDSKKTMRGLQRCTNLCKMSAQASQLFLQMRKLLHLAMHGIESSLPTKLTNRPKKAGK